MVIFSAHIKKVAILALSSLVISLFYFAPVSAQSLVEQYLYQIAQNTYNTLQIINTFPAYLQTITTTAASWMVPPDANTGTIATNLTTMGTTMTANLNTQNSTATQQQILSALFGTNTTPKTMPYANDLSYPTLLNLLYFDPDPRMTPGKKSNINPQLNYIKYASGFTIPHLIPGGNLGGTADAQNLYTNYYMNITAAESFTGYILSGVYADYINGLPKGNSLTDQQNTLITQATAATWFTEVGGEALGIVLRQLLMYESQVFVLLSQLLQIEKQVLTAQALNNSLLIATSLTNENYLVQKATGVIR